MKRTVTLLAAIMLAIGTVQLVKAQPSSEPMMKDKDMMMDEGKGMMDEGMGMANKLDDTMMEGMGEGAEDWSLEEEGMDKDDKAMDKAMGMGMQVNKTK